tara:strand:- start:1439 stop:2131 length:693 start_codon:yes stop_codon:yes gene_type:complete
MSRSAEKDLRNKLRLENQFVNRLGQILKSPISIQTRLLERFLLGHYTRTYDGFKNSFQNRRGVEMTKFQRLRMRDYTQGEFDKRASRQAKLITDNTRKIWGSIQQLDLPVHEQRNMFQFRMGIRATRIVSTETEWSAERTKLREVQFLQNGPNEKNSGKKRWDIIGDDRMREHHLYAAKQLVDIESPFDVASELLMFPGDTDLGASAGNIINCRCSAFYSVPKKYLTKTT